MVGAGVGGEGEGGTGRVYLLTHAGRSGRIIIGVRQDGRKGGGEACNGQTRHPD